MWKKILLRYLAVIMNLSQFAIASELETTENEGIIIEEVCVPHQIAELERYLSEFDLPEVPISNTATYPYPGIDYGAVAESRELPAEPLAVGDIESTPLGSLPLDLKRLRILQDLLTLPEDKVLRSKLSIVYKVLIAANQRARKSAGSTACGETHTQNIEAVKNTPNYSGDEMRIDSSGTGEREEVKIFLTTSRQRAERSTHNQNYGHTDSSDTKYGGEGRASSSLLGAETTLDTNGFSETPETLNFGDEKSARDPEIGGKSNPESNTVAPRIEGVDEIFGDHESPGGITDSFGGMATAERNEIETTDPGFEETGTDSILEKINTDPNFQAAVTRRNFEETITDLKFEESFTNPRLNEIYTDSTPKSSVTDPNFKVTLTDPNLEKIIPDSKFEENFTGRSLNEINTDSTPRNGVTDSNFKVAVTDLNSKEIIPDSKFVESFTDPILNEINTDSIPRNSFTDSNFKAAVTDTNVEKSIPDSKFEKSFTDPNLNEINTESTPKSSIADSNFKSSVTDSNSKKSTPDSKFEESLTDPNLNEINTDSTPKSITDSNFKLTVTDSNLKGIIPDSKFEEGFTDPNLNEINTDSTPKSTLTDLNIKLTVTDSNLKVPDTDSNSKETIISDSKFEESFTDPNLKEMSTYPTAKSTFTDSNFDVAVTDSNPEETTTGSKSEESFLDRNWRENSASRNSVETYTASVTRSTVTDWELRNTVSDSDSDSREAVTVSNPIKMAREYVPVSGSNHIESSTLENRYSNEPGSGSIKGEDREAEDPEEAKVTGSESGESRERVVASETINEMRSPSPEGGATTEEIKPDVGDEDRPGARIAAIFTEPFISSSKLSPIDQNPPRYAHFTSPVYPRDKNPRIFLNYNERAKNDEAPAAAPTTKRTLILNIAESFSNVPRPVEVAPFKKKGQKSGNHIYGMRKYYEEGENSAAPNPPPQEGGFQPRNRHRVGQESAGKLSADKFSGFGYFRPTNTGGRQARRGGHNTDVEKLYRWFYRGGDVPGKSAAGGAEVRCNRRN